MKENWCQGRTDSFVTTWRVVFPLNSVPFYEHFVAYNRVGICKISSELYKLVNEV